MSIKILIPTGIFPPDIGGPATYVPKIAQGLTDRGHQVHVITLSDATDIDDSQYPFPITRILRTRFGPGRFLRTVLEILRRGRQCDAIYANGLPIETALANLWLKKPLAIKVVGDFAWERAVARGWTQASFEAFQQNTETFRAGLLKKMRNWPLQQADRVIVPSQFLAYTVSDWGILREKIEVIYNAVELPSEIPPASVPLKTPIKLVTVGRLVPWKNIDGIIEAIADLQDLGLIVVGDGPERPRLEALAADRGVSARVCFAGAKRRTETLSLMAAADLFVLNSTYEGLPHVLVEAMAIGLPIVTTDVGGCSELRQFSKTDFLTIPKDVPGALQQALKETADRGGTRKPAHTNSSSGASFAVMVQQTEELLQELAYGVT